MFPEDFPIAAFNVENRRYEILSMAFRLKNILVIFECVMDNALRGLDNTLVYLYDIIVCMWGVGYSKNTY